MPLGTNFDQIGNGIKNIITGKMGADLADQDAAYQVKKNGIISGVVKPATRQLGNAIPAQPGSLSGLMQKNKGGYIDVNLQKQSAPIANMSVPKSPNNPMGTAVGTNKGMLPEKSTAQLHQDNISANQNIAKATAAAVKHSTDTNNSKNTTPTDTTTPTTLPINGSTTGATTTNGIINSSPQTTTPSSTYQSATTGLLSQGNAQDPTYEAAIKKAADLQNQETQGVVNLGREPMTAGDFMGQSGTLISGLNSEIGNQQALAANALKSKDQQITANTQAGNLTQPQGNTAYFGSPEGGGIVGGGGGGSFPGATGNGLIDNTVLTALQQVAAGGDPTNNPGFDAVKALNSPQAVNAYNQGVAAIKGGTYNPTTASASAQQNATQRAAFQQQATELGTALQGLSKVGQLADNFLTATGLNPNTSAFVNAQQNTTIGQLKNPSNIATYNELVNQVQTYAGQIFASTGMTPTAADSMAKNITIDGMPVNALKAFLNNLDVIGQSRKSVLDKAATTDYSSGGNTSGSFQTLENSNQYYKGDDSNAEAAAGAIMNLGGGFAAVGSALLKLIGL